MLKTGKVLLAIAASFSLVLSGCGFQANSGSNMKLSDEQVLRIAEEGGITTLDTVKANDAITFNVLNNVNEGLMRLGRKNNRNTGLRMNMNSARTKPSIPSNCGKTPNGVTANP